jgi:hypothetical protein
MDDAARLRARVLLRQRWGAAVALGVVAALGGGLVLSLALVAKDTSSAVDRYVARLDAPNGLAVYCPPDVDMASVDADECVRYDQAAEVAALRALPNVEATGRASATPIRLRTAARDWTESFAWVLYDGVSTYGRLQLVAGRPARPGAADEAIVNEAFLARYGVELGDVVDIAPFTWDEFDDDEAMDHDPSTAILPVRIAGVVRTPADLVFGLENYDALSVAEAMMLLGEGWVDATGGNFARYQNGVIVHVAQGADPAEVLRSVSPDHVGMVSTESMVESDVASLRDAVAYEARATWAAAGLSALAVLVLVGQMFVRQARRELDDAIPMRAMGATTGLFVRSSLPRWALSAAIGAGGAAVVGLLGRGRGPVGVARQMLGAAPLGLDAVVAPAALVGVAALVLVAGLGGTALAARPLHASRMAPRRSPHPAPTVAGTAGLAWLTSASGRGRGQVIGLVAGLTVAVSAVITAIAVVSSLSRLTADPPRFGATWDATVSSVLGPESARPVIDGLAHLDGVDAVAGILGDNGVIGGGEVYVYAFAPVPGLPSGIAPVVTSGRAPSESDEIALGATTLAASGAEIGDTVELTYLEQTRRLRVVGEVIVYDTWEDRPGVGAVVDHHLLEDLEPGASTTDYAVRFQPGRATAGRHALDREFPGQVTGPVVPGAVRNLERISAWPGLLAGLVGLLALAALVHALMVTVRRQRSQLAVLRALGFRRRQLGATVSWYTTALVVPAVILGFPLGAAVGRWGWGVLAGELGVTSGPVVPLGAVTLVLVAAAFIANLVAAPLAWRAGRVDTVTALRAE